MYEPRTRRPLTRQRFVARMVSHAAAALGLVLGSLAMGMAGYMSIESHADFDGLRGVTC
jgi:hypothetical protein